MTNNNKIKKSPEEQAQLALLKLENADDRLRGSAVNCVRKTAKLLDGEVLRQFLNEVHEVCRRYIAGGAGTRDANNTGEDNIHVS
jgi:hypothetical protein